MQISNELLEHEEKLLLPPKFFLTQFNKVKNRSYEKDKDKKFKEFIKLFCFEVSGKKGKYLKLFSSHFEMWVQNELNPVDLLKATEEYNEKVKQLNTLNSLKSIVDSKIRRQALLIKSLSALTFTLLLIALLYVFMTFDFGNYIEPIKEWIMIAVALSTLFFGAWFSHFRVPDFIKRSIEISSTKIRKRYKFDPDEYQLIIEKITQLKNRIKFQDQDWNENE